MGFRTPISCSGTGVILDKGELSRINNVNSIGLKISTERKRKAGNETVSEEDIFWIRFWSTGADIVNDIARIGDTIWFEAELRNKKGFEIKVKHFELYKENSNENIVV